MLSKGKATALLSAAARCPSSGATTPEDAGVGDKAGPTPTPLHPGCFLGTSAREATLVTRDCVAVPGLGSVSPGIREMRLMNVQSNVSIANLRALLQQCPETEPLLQDMGREKKKRAGAQSRLPMLWGQCCGYLAPSLFQNVSLERWQKESGNSQGENPEDSSAVLPKDFPMETMKNCLMISPTD